MDWGIFTWKDNSRPVNTLNTGMILGFVTFNDKNFQIPLRIDEDASVPSVDETVYVVARCLPFDKNFDKKFITEIQLIPGKESVFIVPVHDLVSPACVVPNIFTHFRMRQGSETWLFVKPRRKWGGKFGDLIQWAWNVTS